MNWLNFWLFIGLTLAGMIWMLSGFYIASLAETGKSWWGLALVAWIVIHAAFIVGAMTR